MKRIAVVIAALAASGCATVAVTRDQIRTAPDVQWSGEVAAGYQALAKCWSDRADRIAIDFADATRLDVFADLGLAEITSGQGGFVHVLIELRRIDADRTAVAGYGVGHLGTEYLPRWVATLQGCAQV